MLFTNREEGFVFTMDLYNLTLAGLIIFIGSFFATVSGFGFALVATPLLAMIMPVGHHFHPSAHCGAAHPNYVAGVGRI